MKMKYMLFLALALMLCLTAGGAMAAIQVNGIDALPDENGCIYIDEQSVKVSGSGENVFIVVKENVSQLYIENLIVTAPAGYHALDIQSDNITLIAKGNNTLTAGNGECDGIFAAGSITIRGSLTTNGGYCENTNYGGRGIWAESVVTIAEDAVVVANGGSCAGKYGNDAIYAYDRIIVNGKVTANGGHSNAKDGDGGEGLDANEIIINGTATVTAGNALNSDGEGGKGLDGNKIVINGTATVNGGKGTCYGGNGIKANESVQVSGMLTTVGGADSGSGTSEDDYLKFGAGIYCEGTVTIAGDVEAAAGNDRQAAIVSDELKLNNQVGCESADKQNWVETLRNTLRYFSTKEPVVQIPETLPETGDNSNVILWSALVFISLLGMMALVCKRKEA